jgi:hypothetical protein
MIDCRMVSQDRDGTAAFWVSFLWPKAAVAINNLHIRTTDLFSNVSAQASLADVLSSLF